MNKYLFCFVLLICLSLGFSVARATLTGGGTVGQSWQTAPKHSSGMAPDPEQWADTAIVQVYIAPTFGWRGFFAVHPWLIYKRIGETHFTRYDVIGWGGDNAIHRNYALPDGLWYGSQPKLLVDHRGSHVETMIDEIEAAIVRYPFPRTYQMYPGPNSNTFLAHIGREVPALELDLPANAIGKDYRSLNDPIGLSATGKGIQASFLGLLGVSLGLQEGIEFNVLGLDFGLDLNHPALRLPFLGRLGMDNMIRDIREE